MPDLYAYLMISLAQSRFVQTLLTLLEKLLVQMDPGNYFFINQGCLTVDNMNDQEEMQIVDVRNQNLSVSHVSCIAAMT